MKKFLLSVLLLPVLASAQGPVIVEKQVVCADAKSVIEVLSKEFSEKPIWLGDTDNSRYSLFTNKNGSWTLIQFDKDTACIIGAGKSNSQIFLSPDA